MFEGKGKSCIHMKKKLEQPKIGRDHVHGSAHRAGSVNLKLEDLLDRRPL